MVIIIIIMLKWCQVKSKNIDCENGLFFGKESSKPDCSCPTAVSAYYTGASSKGKCPGTKIQSYNRG